MSCRRRSLGALGDGLVRLAVASLTVNVTAAFSDTTGSGAASDPAVALLGPTSAEGPGTLAILIASDSAYDKFVGIAS